jgi:hypothetical protein
MNAIMLTTISMALPLWWSLGLLALALLGRSGCQPRRERRAARSRSPGNPSSGSEDP